MNSIEGGGLGVRDPIGGGGLGVRDPIGRGLGVGDVIRGRIGCGSVVVSSRQSLASSAVFVANAITKSGQTLKWKRWIK